ncbi:unnamed protein product, partial [marine sediment metagenome]
MKLDVQGIEEIEITDPAGLCNPPVPQLPSAPPLPGIPITPFQPAPQIPTPFGPSPLPGIPGWGDVCVPHGLPNYTRHVHDPNDYRRNAKWGIGSPAIHQAGKEIEGLLNRLTLRSGGKNWQSKMNGAG